MRTVALLAVLLVYVLTGKLGLAFAFEGRGEVFRDAAGRPQRIVGVCVDITERKRADERNRVLADIARSISASLDIDTVLPHIADGVRALCESDTAARRHPCGRSPRRPGPSPSWWSPF